MNQSKSADSSVPALPSFRSPAMMNRDDTAVIVVDVQTKLMPSITDGPKLLASIERLIAGAQILQVPIRITEQYPRGLGSTEASIRGLLDDATGPAFEKRMFSCRECRELLDELLAKGVNKLLLCGIETHVCVAQTALDCLALGFSVWLPVDAVGARFPLDHQTAIRRMENSGVTVTTVEAALFEWCETSTAEEFKAISKLVQQPRFN